MPSPSCSVHANIVQLTVYTDVEAPDVRGHIERYAARLCPSNYRLITPPCSHHQQEGNSQSRARTLHDHPSPDGSSACRSGVHASREPFFITAWEQEAGDVARIVHNTIPFMNVAECYITQSGDLSSGEVVYALYRRQMPVLSLCVPTHTPSLSSVTPEDTSQAREQTQNEEADTRSINDAIVELLYHPRTIGHTAKAAIDTFFLRAMSSGATAAEGRVVCIEGICPTASHMMRAHEEDTSALVACVADALAVCAPSCPTAMRVVMDEAGRVRYYANGPAEVSIVRQTEMGPASPGMFGPILDTLTRMQEELSAGANARVGRRNRDQLAARREHKNGNDSNVSNDSNSDGATNCDECEDEDCDNGLSAMLRANPLLPGALNVFNRYENRGLLRALLHRGATVIFVNHCTSSAMSLLAPHVTSHVAGARKGDGSAVTKMDATCDDTIASAAAESSSYASSSHLMTAKDNQAACKDANAADYDAEQCRRHLLALRTLETHWLEMPCPMQTLCVLHRSMCLDRQDGRACDHSVISGEAPTTRLTMTGCVKMRMDDEGNANKCNDGVAVASGSHSAEAVLHSDQSASDSMPAWLQVTRCCAEVLPGWQFHDGSLRYADAATRRRDCIHAMVQWLRDTIAV